MTILSIFVCLLSVLSCGSDNEETEVAVIDVSPAQLSATHEGLVTSATINSGLEWTAFSDDACKDWISCKITDNGSQGNYRARRIQTGVERRVQQRDSTRSRPMVL